LDMLTKKLVKLKGKNSYNTYITKIKSLRLSLQNCWYLRASEHEGVIF